jgi:hypothetical protein
LMLTVLAPSRYAALLHTARGGPNAAKLDGRKLQSLGRVKH